MRILAKVVCILFIGMWLAACGMTNPTERSTLEDYDNPPSETEVSYEDEPFVLQETDVIQVGELVENEEIMNQFVEDSNKGLQSKIRYVLFENDDAESAPVAVYELKAVTDEEAEQSWVDIFRDWRYDAEGYDNLIETQQCSGGISRDEERGAFYLNECFHKWEIRLMPINEFDETSSDPLEDKES